MESKTNYRFVGLVVILLTAGLIITSLWLSIGFERKKYNYYTVYMQEAVTGLSNESPVRYNGVQVGMVDNIELSQIDPQQTKITIKVEAGTPITTSTYATLITQGITGTTYLGLTPGTSSFVPLQKRPGEKYPVIASKPSFFNRLEKSINQISHGFKMVLTRENADNLNRTLVNLQKSTEALAKNQRNLNQALQNLPKMVTDIASAGKEVSSTMKTGKDAINKFSNQALPPAIEILRRFEDISANLEKVSAEMRQNPAILVRGTEPPKSGPGE